eukprot:SAG31_NODE_535_length_14348_cov_11.339603_5_plen_123_part_00
MALYELFARCEWALCIGRHLCAAHQVGKPLAFISRGAQLSIKENFNTAGIDIGTASELIEQTRRKAVVAKDLVSDMSDVAADIGSATMSVSRRARGGIADAGTRFHAWKPYNALLQCRIDPY